MTDQELFSPESNFEVRTIGTHLGCNRATAHPRNVVKFAPQEHVFMQGDTPKGIYKVLRGTVILYPIDGGWSAPNSIFCVRRRVSCNDLC